MQILKRCSNARKQFYFVGKSSIGINDRVAHKLQSPLIRWQKQSAPGLVQFRINVRKNYANSTLLFFFIFIPWSAFGAFVRVLGTCYGKETSRFCQAQNFEASFLCTAHFITSACSFNIGLALLLGIRSLDPRSRTRTAPALTWCRRQLGSQTSCSTKSRSQYLVLNI